jgi:hypothetical protein
LRVINQMMSMTSSSGILSTDGTAAETGFSRNKPVKINAITHPDYISLNPYWMKWRICYVGGEEFKRIFLKPFSSKEDANNFLTRRTMTYVPAFAKTGINEIRNSIYQRLTDINRVTTSKTYNEAVVGKSGGVDRRGSSMEYFLGTQVLTELLVMGKVAIYVDNPNVQAVNYAESVKVKPYMYVYKAEQIRSWVLDDHGDLLSVLLEDVNYDSDKSFQLPIATTKAYRFYWISDDDGLVHCQIYDDNGLQKGPEIILNVKKIPLHILNISSSMMNEISDYQIALMNMASSDVQFSRLALHPMYIEFYEPMSELMSGGMQGDVGPDGITPVLNNGSEVRISGNLNGRKIPNDIKPPTWIAPDTLALTASMDKQKQMKEEIRTLLYLSLGNLQATRQSADSKAADVSQEENGLSYIGFELSLAENKICEFWHAYENNTQPFSINYPQTYDIKTTSERVTEATGYLPIMKAVPSTTGKKEIAKLIAKALLNGRAPYEKLQKIYDEIDANALVVDPETLVMDVETKLVSHKYASELRGYPDGESKKAADEATELAKQIMEAQMPPSGAVAPGLMKNPAARGLPELSADPKADITVDRNKNQEYKSRGKAKKPLKSTEGS